MITTPIIIPIMNQQFALGGGEIGEVCFSLDKFSLRKTTIMQNDKQCCNVATTKLINKIN